MLYYLQNILRFVNRKGGGILKVLQVRLPESIIEWLEEMANKEGLAISTMLRIFLDREMHRDLIDKQFDKRKVKNGNNNR